MLLHARRVISFTLHAMQCNAAACNAWNLFHAACNAAAWASSWSKRVLPCGRQMECNWWKLFVVCGLSFTLHGWIPSSFFRVADRWDARLMTAVCWFVGSLSRLVILDTCSRIGFFSNLSDRLSMFCGEMFPTNYSCLYGHCQSRHMLLFFGSMVHVCILTRWVISLVTLDL